jgi:hypothetical protein
MMKPGKKISLGLVLTASSLVLAACGGSSGGPTNTAPGAPAAGSSGPPAGSSPPSTGSTGGSGATGTTGSNPPGNPNPGGTVGAQPTLAQRIAAATTTADNNSACTSITPFYWEVGDKNGAQASGSGGTGALPPPNADTKMMIASASKWMFSTYVVQQKGGKVSASDIKFLTFESGYTNFSDCSSSSTVTSCLAEPGDLPGTNGQHFDATDGKFYYNGGHMQVLASTLSIGPDNNANLATDMRAQLGANVPIVYAEPQLAGGIFASANVYAQFLRNMLGGTYGSMFAMLGSNAVCTHTNSSDCPNALYSPVDQSKPGGPNDVSNESWHYSLGHWVEDDPTVGDGAFSSPGRFGFYPWIDHSKTYYGVLARYDAADVDSSIPTKAPYFTSAQCGRLIRSAWINGRAQ